MSNPSVIYLGPACQEQGDGREWCQDDVWTRCECGHESVRYVLAEDHDRTGAERNALQQRLNAADQRNDELVGWVRKYRNVIASRRYSNNDEGDMHQRADRIELERLDAALKADCTQK